MASSETPPGVLDGLRILLVEDDFLVGQVIMELLEDAGATVLGPLGSVEQALAFIAEKAGSFDRAVLDLNLHGRKSYPVADALLRMEVPFVFTTGYGLEAIDPAYRSHPHCMKPITRAALLAACTEG
jgi:CheY-like chemotaxis protein